MGFADAYLLKAGLRDKLIASEPHPELKIIVTIPVHNESGLERCLDSLFSSASSAIQAEVLILINAPSDASPEIVKQNKETFEATLAWISDHSNPNLIFHVWIDHSFSRKDAGVGMARKILMDEAVRRFSQIDHPNGIIASMDADAVVEKNYLGALVRHFKRTYCDGSSLYFEHPLTAKTISTHSDGEPFSQGVFEAIIQYELHLRYYLQSLRSTGYPYAYHTVGSSFAVTADIYCKEGGMNRRQGGEDFYFIQKIAQRGNFSECHETCVIPSPRPSDRVPFGTGRAVSDLLAGHENLKTYNPGPFQILRHFFSDLESLFAGETTDQVLQSQPDVLIDFLETQEFIEALTEIRKNSSSLPSFRKRFWRWFNMFRIMKFLHYARENGYADVPVGEASLDLLKQIRTKGIEIPDKVSDLKKLLLAYRQMER